jgi:presenilin-like A22 family membrane protease
MTEDKKIEMKDVFPVILMGGLFVIIQGLALLVVGPFETAGMKAFENPNDPMNLVYIFLILLVVTSIILLIAKFWKKRLIQVIILGAIGYTAAYLFYPLFALVIPESPVVSEWLLSAVLSISAAIILVVTLFKYPEWYVIDISGIIVGAGAIAIFGISLGVFLAILLLVGLAVYDAIAVYKTKHMIDLADTVLDLKLPVLLVIPKIRHYSLIKETKSLKEKLKDDEERDAFFMGLGDVVMPGILVAAAYHSIENGLPIALSVMIGTLVGFVVLMSFVIKGKPQAGLPCLGGGAILGYIVSSYLLSGELIGLTFSI